MRGALRGDIPSGGIFKYNGTMSKIFALFVAGLLLAVPLTGLMSMSRDAGPENPQVRVNDAGMKNYSVESHGLSIQFIQLLPDFVRAVFAKQQFPPDEVERIADYCVYGTILRNITDDTLHFHVHDWQYRTEGGQWTPVKTKQEWLKEWRESGIAFSWTLLPSQGDFRSGDWQQGFTTIKAPRDQRFDLRLRWSVGDSQYEYEIEDMQCPQEQATLMAEQGEK